MRKDKSPGLKILWIWTFGTAAILVANVVRSSVRDMETTLGNAEPQQHNAASTPDSSLLSPSDHVIPEDKD
ncbi:hypothetical protein Lal_00024279 [Lupinus albus]|uniref:Uncharacterized protein n=1 Tax=Lupinus albus TaxID=3870 RepID=A0A6A5M5R3_LUPAL|nr:hypothetical protein Lalb_Chr25g0282841 [Lupinus albus]KAF1866275.1 hypothetical protein Lal_00024279 [Lupinus albus]